MVFPLLAAGAALLGGALAGWGQAKAATPGYYDAGGGYMVREPTPGYGTQTLLPSGAAGKGVLGGQVIARGRQMMMIQTPDGRRILVKTQKRRKAPQRRQAGTKMDKLLELAVISSMFRK
jgi:hypothetical protein